VYRVCLLHRGDRVVGQLEPSSGSRAFRDALLDGGRQLESSGRSDSHRRAQHHTGLRQRRRDVVAVTHVGNRPAVDVAELDERQAIGQRLARVLLVGQCVHHTKLWRRGRKGLQSRLRESPNHGLRDPALEIARNILDRLAAAQRDLLGWLNHVAAMFPHGDLKRRTSP
jgi:hypothetical protein